MAEEKDEGPLDILKKAITPKVPGPSEEMKKKVSGVRVKPTPGAEPINSGAKNPMIGVRG